MFICEITEFAAHEACTVICRQYKKVINNKNKANTSNQLF